MHFSEKTLDTREEGRKCRAVTPAVPRLGLNDLKRYGESPATPGESPRGSRCPSKCDQSAAPQKSRANSMYTQHWSLLDRLAVRAALEREARAKHVDDSLGERSEKPDEQRRTEREEESTAGGGA